VTIKDEYPDPDTPGNKRGHLRLKWKDKVEWQVFYRIVGGATTPATADVTIADFQREFPSTGTATQPFLNTAPVVLTATQGSATPARETRESRDKNGGDPPTGISTYKYSITVKINGLPEIKLDPRVVFDE